MSKENKIAIGISSCLLGDEVRYDGGHKLNSCIEQTLGQYFQLKKFCPEVASDLGIPRPPVQLQETAQGIRCVGVEDHNWDVTERLQNCSQQQHDWLAGLSGYILKKNSPSCGMAHVIVYRNNQPHRIGTGLFAQYIKQHFPLMPMEEEDSLAEADLRENFIRNVLVYHQRKHAPNT